jgi:hypothetical protein
LDIALALGQITNEELVAGAHCLRERIAVE